MRRLWQVLATCAAVSLLASAPAAAAQKKPKRALSDGDARRAIAAMAGFALNTGAVKVREVSAAGVEPVTVAATVTTGFRFVRPAAATSGAWGLIGAGPLAAGPAWRAVEVRTGDRTWDGFEFLAAPLGDETVRGALAELESLVAEFETRQREQKSAEPVTRGPLSVKLLSPLGSSAVAEISVEAVFRLARGPDRKWRVVEVSVGGRSSGELAALVASVDAQKSARARAELETLRAALEAFRRERGFYVVAADETVLMDHLSPRYVGRVIRIDPWHRPYRYEGTRERFALSSDGPDGRTGTPDDLTSAGG